MTALQMKIRRANQNLSFIFNCVLFSSSMLGIMMLDSQAA